MIEQIKKIDYSFAYDIEKSETNEDVYLVIEQALIQFGLRETAKQFKRKMFDK